MKVHFGSLIVGPARNLDPAVTVAMAAHMVGYIAGPATHS